MPHRIRIPVHHEKCILATRDDQVLRVIARSRRRFEEVAVARLLLEIRGRAAPSRNTPLAMEPRESQVPSLEIVRSPFPNRFHRRES